jgi:hypothetical protein
MKTFKTFMTESNKGWIGVDLDATLAYYTGWKGPYHIGKPVPGMLKKVKAALDAGEDVRIFTARAGENERAKRIIRKWCIKYIGKELLVTNIKDKHCREIWDDRAKQVIKNKGTFVE